MVLVTNMCPACGHELTQKPRSRLTFAGLALLVAAAFLIFRPYVWLIAILMAAIAIYLLMWSILGKGKWCRRCKKFPVSKSLAG